jgi:hypothetical protein
MFQVPMSSPQRIRMFGFFAAMMNSFLMDVVVAGPGWEMHERKMSTVTFVGRCSHLYLLSPAALQRAL